MTVNLEVNNTQRYLRGTIIVTEGRSVSVQSQSHDDSHPLEACSWVDEEENNTQDLVIVPILQVLGLKPELTSHRKKIVKTKFECLYYDKSHCLKKIEI